MLAKPVDLNAYRDRHARLAGAPAMPGSDPHSANDAAMTQAPRMPGDPEPPGMKLTGVAPEAGTVFEPYLIEAWLDEGLFEQAAPAIAALIEADPGEAATWFLQARLLAGSGNHADAQEACRRAIELWPDILPVYRLLSDVASQAGGDAVCWLDTAERMLLAHWPEDAALANRIAGRLCADGRIEAALPFLRQAAPILGHQDSALWNYSTSLALTGRYHELLSIEPLLGLLARDVPPPFAPFAHLAAARLALRLDRAAVLREITAVQSSPRWIDAASLAGRLAEAIAQGRPFSVILLSERHARLVAYASLRVHLILSEAEMSAVVNSVWMESFGDPIESHGAAPAGALCRMLLAAIAETDVVALPDAARLAAAHEHLGFLAEMQRIVLQREPGLCAGPMLMDEMHDAMPFLHTLLAGQPFLGFVGSDPDLAGRLGRFARIGEIVTYVVPADLNGRGHFPTLFEQTLAGLAVPFPGAVFLVAAGLLGVMYCARIRRLGGIAIEIDTIVPRWTR